VSIEQLCRLMARAPHLTHLGTGLFRSEPGPGGASSSLSLPPLLQHRDHLFVCQVSWMSMQNTSQQSTQFVPISRPSILAFCEPNFWRAHTSYIPLRQIFAFSGYNYFVIFVLSHW
jgi:hypothetical protein